MIKTLLRISPLTRLFFVKRVMQKNVRHVLLEKYVGNWDRYGFYFYLYLLCAEFLDTSEPEQMFRPFYCMDLKDLNIVDMIRLGCILEILKVNQL
jgi:hypothetical protein